MLLKFFQKKKGNVYTRNCKIGVEEFEFFIFDWQKKELDFSLSLATKKIIKKGLNGNWLRCNRSVNLPSVFCNIHLL